ncbi:hypothetical protein F66182_17056, partial [Fusarium sp. NRRL 66182]
MTCGLLLGCNADQQTFIRQQLQELSGMTRHPLLLPIILARQQQIILYEKTEGLWDELLQVENVSGQTGVVLVPMDDESLSGRRSARATSKKETQKDHISNKRITNKALGVMQLTSVWESQTRALVQDINAIRESMTEVSAVLSYSKSDVPVPAPSISEIGRAVSGQSILTASSVSGISGNSGILEKSLALLLQNSNTMLWDLEFINKRAAAQIDAVYNDIAQQIATATKKDNSDMKAIAVLTMAFLPATFLA